MRRQMEFQLAEQTAVLQLVWEEIPASNKKKLIKLYAKLTAEAARAELRVEAKKKGSNDAVQ